jgi:peptide/nickel transport system ATP-binding protein
VILNPSHPYTQILANAAPNPAASRASLEAAREERQSARAARAAEHRETVSPGGCRFRPRCPFAMDTCARHPGDLPVTDAHLARCWLYGEST